MRTTCIQHPEKDFFVRMSAWQIIACDGDHCAAALLSLFEYWHNNRLANADQAKRANEVAERLGEPATHSESLVHYHTAEQLRASLLNLFAEDGIREAVKRLKAKGFVTVTKNPNPRYAFDKTLHFYFHPEAVNAWLAKYKPSDKPVIPKKPSPDTRKNGDASPENPAPCKENPVPSGEKPVSHIEETVEATPRRKDGASALALGAGLPPSGSGGGDPTGGHGSLEGEAFSLSAPRPRPAPSAKPCGATRAFTDGWCERFKRRTGAAYVFEAAKDGVAVKRLLAADDAESLLNLVDRCEDAPNDSAHWACKRALETVAKFSSLLNSVRCELAAKPMTRPVVRSVPEPHAIREEVAVPVMRF